MGTWTIADGKVFLLPFIHEAGCSDPIGDVRFCESDIDSWSVRL